MHATGKIFDKISLKLLGISFFGICDPWSEEGSRYSIFWYGVWGEMSNRKTKFKLLVIRGDPRPPIPCLSWSSWSPRKENPEKGLGPLSVTIFKKVSESIFFQNLQRVKLKMKTRWQILWWSWCSIYWKISFHFNVRSISGPIKT